MTLGAWSCRGGGLGLLLGLLTGCACQESAAPLLAEARPHGVSKPSSAVGKGVSLRVMTFNLRVRTRLDGSNIWDRRRDLVVHRIRAFDPDVLGTQEGLDPMQTFLRQELPAYTFRGVGRSDGVRRGEMCGVYFRTSRFELLDSGHFWLSPTPEKPGSRGWGAVFPRMVTWVKLKPIEGGPAFCWFNTHFDAWNNRARVESAKLLRERMDRIAGVMPCIVTGDFNAAPDSVPYRTLLAPGSLPSSSLYDVYRAAHPVDGPDEGTLHFFSGRTGGRRMDWILASSHYRTVDSDIDRTRGATGYPSDHFPVTATLRLPAEIKVPHGLHP